MVKLPIDVSSPQDISALILDVKAAIRQLRHDALKHHESRQEPGLPDTLSPVAVDYIRGWSKNKPLSPSSLEPLLAALEDHKRSAPVISITLAAPPPLSVRKALVEWCRHNITPDVLVAFDFNSLLLGGMVVRTGSHIFDWSFRRLILEKRSAFPEALRHV